VRLSRKPQGSSDISKRPVDALVRCSRVGETSAVVQANWIILYSSQVLEINALFCFMVGQFVTLTESNDRNETHVYPAMLQAQSGHQPSQPTSARPQCLSILSGICLPYPSTHSWVQHPYRASCRRAGFWFDCF
jgi:hypothetical protein